MNYINGRSAVEILDAMSDLVFLHRKDNTDKFWSYKFKGGQHYEFAFDPRTKKKLVVRFDRKPPCISGVEDIQHIADDSISTALNRVFSGGAHAPHYKALIRDEGALRELVRVLATSEKSAVVKLPSHGPIKCRECWKDYSEDTAERITSDGQFRLVNDPGAWGANDPEVLVLGISKGETQARAFAEGAFDEVAFRKRRIRLRESLAAISLVSPDDDIDKRMTAVEEAFAFGSVVRCSITGRKNGEWRAGTPEVIPAFSHLEASTCLINCVKRHLAHLPRRLRIVVLTSNDDRWIKVVSHQVNWHYPPDFQSVNTVAYMTGGKLWVHVAHPSPRNGHY